MENQTNGQKRKRAARNKKDLCLRSVTYVQKIAISLHFLLKLNLAKGYTDKNTKIATYLKRTWKKYIFIMSKGG